MKAVKEIKSTNYYAWQGIGLQVYIYTTTENPQIGDTLYNYDGTSFEASTAEITNVSNNIITTDTYVPGVGVMSYERDNSADTFITETNFKSIKNNADYKLISEPHTELIPAVGILGGLTNTNNVLSNFTVNNYAQLPQELDLSTANYWEMVFKIKLDNSFSSSSPDSCIIGTNVVRKYSPRLVVWNNLQVALQFSNSTSSWNICNINSGSTYLAKNTWYWIKATYAAARYYLYISTDGVNYAQVGAQNSSTLLTSVPLVNIGYCDESDTGEMPFSGEIDLTESYIKVNNNIRWQGIKEINVQ